MEKASLPEDLAGCMKSLEDERTAEEKRVAAKGPQVAVFYVIDGRIYGHGDDLSAAKVEGSMLWPRINHISWWENARDFLPAEVSGRSPSYYPRGRIIYSKHQGTFWIVLDGCINTPEWIDALKDKYNLQDQSVGVYEEPSHYSCHRCR